MKARLVRIGNSRGVRLPKPFIEQVGLSDEVDIQVRDGAVVIVPTRSPRSGWAVAAKQIRERNEDMLLDPVTSTHFDEREWEW